MTLQLDKVKWADIAEQVKNVNPEFAELIEQNNEAKSLDLYIAEYKFGDLIINEGVMYLPDSTGELVAMTPENMSKSMYQELGYNLGTNPITMVLHNNSELLVSTAEKTLPFNLYQPGDLLGLSTTFNVKRKSAIPLPIGVSTWDMTAGARTCFMLPKISEDIGLNKLMRKYDFVVDKPHSLFDHWKILRQIGKHSDWRCRLLLFPYKWFQRLKEPEWAPVKNYFYECYVSSFYFWTNSFPWNLTFSLIQKKRSILTSVAATETIKYIFGIGSSFLPGFIPSVNEHSLPVQYIQDAFVKEYELKKYMPIIMEPAYLDRPNTKAAYFSLQAQIAPGGLDVDPRGSFIKNFDELYHSFRRYLKELSSSSQQNNNTMSLYHVITQRQFQFYHSNADKYDYMHNAIELADMPEFKQASKNLKGDFPNTSTFFKGCIRIS